MSSESVKEGSILKNASIVAAGTLVSRIAGLIRDQVTAFYFGAGPIADAFFVAFRLPNLLRRLLAEGALTPAFVPVFTERLVKDGRQAASQLFQGVMSLMTLILSGITIIGVIFAPFLVGLIAPGFKANPELFDLTVLLARILFPYILLITLTALAMGVLNSLGRYDLPALGPVFLNICMILGAVLISPLLETPIIGLALGALLGGVVQLAIQLPALLKADISLNFTLSLKDPAIGHILKLMAPTALGGAAYQLSIFINTQLASFLEEGSVSYLYYADRLVQFPLGVFSLALATAILPALSQHIAKGNTEEFKELFQKTLKLQFFITLPAMIGLMVMAGPLISILFERGHFDSLSTSQTSLALWGYALGLPFLSGASLAARVFYSRKDTKTPAKVAAISLGLGLIAAIALLFPFGHLGLALGSSFASMVNFSWLCLSLRKKGDLILGPFIKDAILSSFLALIMGAALWPLYHHGYFASLSLIWKILLGLIVGPIIYFAMGYLLKSPNLAPLREICTKIKRKFIKSKDPES
ncbi:MAG: murein biosynthesis integral membrane protein MurJ [Deltaproteobacteria bacterium]|nr:murein biosynthesis integral membrane protein MurJ [Deltaproteobacteria bacterium]